MTLCECVHVCMCAHVSVCTGWRGKERASPLSESKPDCLIPPFSQTIRTLGFKWDSKTLDRVLCDYLENTMKERIDRLSLHATSQTVTWHACFYFPSCIQNNITFDRQFWRQVNLFSLFLLQVKK